MLGARLRTIFDSFVGKLSKTVKGALTAVQRPCTGTRIASPVATSFS